MDFYNRYLEKQPLIKYILIPVGRFLGYNYMVFKNPFELSYSHYVIPSYVPWDMPTSLMSVKNLPRGLYGLLVSPSRGLLVISPVTVLGLVAVIGAIREKQKDFLIAFAIAVIGILFVAA